MEATRRPSAFPTASELSLSQTDEIRLRRKDRDALETRQAVERLGAREKRRRVWILYLIGFMDLFGVSVMVPLMPNFMQNLGASPSLAGLIGSLYGGLQIFSSPLVGKFSDVHGRKTVLLLCFVGPAFGYLAMGLSGSLLMIAIARIPIGILKHGLSISKAYLADITDAEERRAVLGSFNAFSSSGFIFGPLLGGYLADLDPSLQLPFITGAAIFFLNTALVLFVLPALHKTEDGTEKQSRNGTESTEENPHIRSGHHDCEQDPDGSNQPRRRSVSGSVRRALSYLNIFEGVHLAEIWDLLLLRFFLTFSVIIFRSNLSIFLEGRFEIDYKTLGKIISFNGFTSGLASFTCGYVSKLYSSHVTQLLHFSLLMVLTILGITLSSNISVLLVFLTLLAVATSNIRICMLSLILKRGRKEERGAIIGLSNSMSSVSRMLAPSVVGIVQEFSSAGAGYVSVALGAVGVLLLMGYPSETKEH